MAAFITDEVEQHQRLRRIQHELLSAYAEVMTGLIHEEVERRCSGCGLVDQETGEVYSHPSQHKHNLCIWVPVEDLIETCFQAAWEKLDWEDVSLLWMEAIQLKLSPPAHFLEYAPWTSEDYRLGTWLAESQFEEMKELIFFMY